MASLIKPPAKKKPTTPRPGVGTNVGQMGRVSPKPKMNTFKKPAKQSTPGVIDNPADYQKRHPNALLNVRTNAAGKKVATVAGRRTTTPAGRKITQKRIRPGDTPRMR